MEGGGNGGNFVLVIFPLVGCLAVLAADRRRTAEGSRLSIRDVTPDDAGVLQCVAENDHGSILANAVLTVAGTAVSYTRLLLFLLLLVAR